LKEPVTCNCSSFANAAPDSQIPLGIGTRGVSVTTEYTRAAASSISGNTSRLSKAISQTSSQGKIPAPCYYCKEIGRAPAARSAREAQ
jgi:hypothetical protein